MTITLNLQIAAPVAAAAPNQNLQFTLNFPAATAAATQQEVAEGEALVAVKPLAEEVKEEEPQEEKLKEEKLKAEVPQTEAPKAEKQEADEPNAEKNSMHTALRHFLTAHYDLRYNEITSQVELAAHGTSEFLPLTDRLRNTITLEAMAAGIPCWDRDVTRIVNSTAVAAYHPFLAYFDRLPAWDGRDRLDALARRVSDDDVWRMGFRRWFIAAAAQWMNRAEGQANALSPVIVSTAQGWGKSTFCRNLLPPELRTYFYERFDLSSLEAAEARLGRYGLINMDEFDRTTERRMADLKNLIQLPALERRLRYGKLSPRLHRIASFIGTSNRRDLLTDPTGSRRFLCVALTHPIDNSLPTDHAQLFAQLRHLVLSGERLWFTKEEEAEIARANLAFYRQTPAEEVFRATFREATTAEMAAGSATFLSASAIYSQLHKVNAKALRGTSPVAFARLMPSIAHRRKVNMRNGYWVVRRDACGDEEMTTQQQETAATDSDSCSKNNPYHNEPPLLTKTIFQDEND